jgi:hypothetical protein
MMAADEPCFQIIFACNARSGCGCDRCAVAGDDCGTESADRAQPANDCELPDACPEAGGRASPGAHPQVRQTERKAELSAVGTSGLRAGVSSDEIETEIASGPLPAASQEKTGETPRRKKSSIQDGMSFPRICNASKRLSPARPSSADAASAASRPGSLDTKPPKCSA